MTAARLRVAVDARRLQDEPLGGVGRSLAGVVDLLATEVDLVLLTDARRPPIATAIKQCALRPPARTPEVAWLQWNVPRWLQHFDGVFHGTFNQLPYRLPVPAVVTIHDLSFEVHPEGMGAGKRIVFQRQARHAARVAARVLVPTEFTRSELIDVYRVEPGRIAVTPWAVEERFLRARDGAHAASAVHVGGRHVDGPYIVAMGGAPRRGLAVAVAAWRAACRASNGGDGGDGASACTLVVVGREQPGAAPGLVYAGAVSDDEWATLLAGAEAFCYPTRYEGFGVPALEAMACGTPVVCAPVASLPEVLGDAAEWCETPTVDAIAGGLRRVLGDAAHADILRERSLARAAAHPSWEYTAEVTLRAYHDAARR